MAEALDAVGHYLLGLVGGGLLAVGVLSCQADGSLPALVSVTACNLTHIEAHKENSRWPAPNTP